MISGSICSLGPLCESVDDLKHLALGQGFVKTAIDNNLMAALPSHFIPLEFHGILLKSSPHNKSIGFQVDVCGTVKYRENIC